MRKFELLLLIPMVLCFAGCSGGGGDEKPVAIGSVCTDSEVGVLRCGTTAQGKDVVAQCRLEQMFLQWSVVDECIFGCSKGACIGDSLNPDGGKKDVVAPGDSNGETVDADANTEPDDGLFCVPDKRTCADVNTIGFCNELGTAWEQEPCEAGFACNNGFCMEVICTPGAVTGECFSATAYEVCNESGTDHEGAYCEVPLKCYKGACSELQCPPDEKACKGMTAVQQCLKNAQGEYEWQVTETCNNGICQAGSCLSACEANLKENTYLGCDYWAVDLDNVEGGATESVAVVVSVPTSNSGDAEIVITNMAVVPPVALTPAQLSVSDMMVAPGALKVFMLPTGHDLDGSVHTSKTFQVTSTAPVTVHQFNPLNGNNVFTNDASLLLPSNVGGKEYVVMAWPLRTTGNEFRGFMAIIATQAGVTKVGISPSCSILEGANVPAMSANPGTPYEFFMEQGDVLNLETAGVQGADLTGSLITSDKKVNVFGGNECANIPLGVNYCDHVEQQLFPVSAWGTSYVGDAFSPRNNDQVDTWRIVSGKDGTQINVKFSFEAPRSFTLNKGEWEEFESGESFHATGTGPFLVGHYLQGSNYAGHVNKCGNTGIGDPAFSLGVPSQQYLTEYIVLTPSAYQEDYVNIIHKKGTLADVTIDDAPVLAFKPLSVNAVGVGDSEWAVIQLPVPDGVHTIRSQEPIGVTAYGYDCDVSYAYPGGLSLKTIE